MVIIYAALELFLGLGNFESGVAHFAHLGGALTGFLLILYWQGFRLR
jgi:membrane associated rhomboid family serine protease